MLLVWWAGVSGVELFFVGVVVGWSDLGIGV